ncbi:lipase family [Pseudanabaena sp. ABRG5-3]|nr:lipase family [Pseudanabaena sp. ABRG5-3]
MGNMNNKLSQIIPSVKPTALNLQTRPFAPLATQEEESVSQGQNKSLPEKLTFSENILEKLINTPKSESATPVQRRPENRFRAKMTVQAKLTQNQPVQLQEDVKEEKIQEERVEDTEFSNLEPLVQNERYIGISHIQRELVDENAASKVDSLDVVYELIAHKLAYKGIDGIPAEMGQWLDNQGYQRNWLGTVQGSGLFCGLIMPKEGSDKKPVLAFKGTDFGKTGDALADADPVAVGFTAFKLKQEQIQGLISQAGGKVVVTGHSLGGALAQHAASAFTGNISKVVTFQAPGISQEQVRQFNNNVNDMEEDERPEVVHHLATGDIVDLAGGKHIGGSGLYAGKGNAEFFLHNLESSGPNNHTKFLLQDEAFKEQQEQAGIDDEAREQVGLRDSQIGVNQKVGQYDDNPFASNQFIFERGREMAAPGAALLLGGKEVAQGGMGLAKEGLGNWRQGGAWNRTKGVGKMIGGGIGTVAGGVGAVAGGVGAVAGGVTGALGGAIAVGAYETGKGAIEGLSTGAKMGSSAGRALMSGGSGLAEEGMKNWKQGGVWNKTKGVGKMIGGGLGALAGGVTAGVGGLAGGALGGVGGAITGIPKALWKRGKRK